MAATAIAVAGVVIAAAAADDAIAVAGLLVLPGGRLRRIAGFEFGLRPVRAQQRHGPSPHQRTRDVRYRGFPPERPSAPRLARQACSLSGLGAARRVGADQHFGRGAERLLQAADHARKTGCQLRASCVPAYVLGTDPAGNVERGPLADCAGASELRLHVREIPPRRLPDDCVPSLKRLLAVVVARPRNEHDQKVVDNLV
jgi:hypothetical protein